MHLRASKLCAKKIFSRIERLNSAELYDPGIVVVAKVDGRGSIDGQGDQATFNFHARQSGNQSTGSFSFSDPAAGFSFTNAKIRRLSIDGSSAEFTGTADLDGGRSVRFSVRVTDNDDAGSSDTFFMNLSDGYSAVGTLTSGDIRIH